MIVSGSPSSLSRSERVLQYLGELVRQEGFSIKHISVKDIDAADLLFGNFGSSDVLRVADEMKQAKGAIVGSPVYKGAYTGVLKALFDILPQDVLQDTPVLPVMTGGSPSHLLAMEYTLKPLLATVKGINLKGLYFEDSQLDKTSEHPILDAGLLDRSRKQLDYFLGKITEKSIATSAH